MEKNELIALIVEEFDKIFKVVGEMYIFEKIEIYTCDLIKQEVIMHLMSKDVSLADVRLDCYIDYNNNNALILNIDEEFLKRSDLVKLNQMYMKLSA